MTTDLCKNLDSPLNKKLFEQNMNAFFPHAQIFAVTSVNSSEVAGNEEGDTRIL